MAESKTIPPQYQDLPSDAVENLIPRKEYLEPEKNEVKKR